MKKNVRLAILRARHDPGNGKLPDKISEQACIEMLMTNENRTSVLNYWTDNTAGYLDFTDSVLFPWVDIAMMVNDVSREIQFARAKEATEKLNGGTDLSGFDGFALITLPGIITFPNPKFGQPVPAGQPVEPENIDFDFDLGAISGEGIVPYCVLPVMLSDHTVMCHEVGHVLGFEHTYGVFNAGVGQVVVDGKVVDGVNQMYGDPYDIMSATGFGRRFDLDGFEDLQSTPSQPAANIKGWPAPNPAFVPNPRPWMGPAPALAHIHQWDPDAFPKGSVYERDLTGGEHNLRIYAAAMQNNSPRLIVVHPPIEDEQGRYRCYVEYRDTQVWDELTNFNWDAGLGMKKSIEDLARPAVVVHTLADALKDGVRCWYRGRIVVPLELDSDVEVYGTPLVVRVIDADVNDGYVDVKIATKSPRGVEVRFRKQDEILDATNTEKLVTPCGDTVVHGTWVMESHHNYQPISYGFGGAGEADAPPLQLTWTVAGQPLKPGIGKVKVATMSGLKEIDYHLNGDTGELDLDSELGDSYSVLVMITVAEADGSHPVTKELEFNPPGAVTGFGPGHLSVLNDCMGKFLKRVKVHPKDLLIPPGPNPFQATWRDKVNQWRIENVIKKVAPSYPAEAAALKALVAMRFSNL